MKRSVAPNPRLLHKQNAFMYPTNLFIYLQQMYNANQSTKPLVKFCGRQYSRGTNRDRQKRMNQEREDN